MNPQQQSRDNTGSDSGAALQSSGELNTGARC